MLESRLTQLFEIRVCLQLHYLALEISPSAAETVLEFFGFDKTLYLKILSGCYEIVPKLSFWISRSSFYFGPNIVIPYVAANPAVTIKRPIMKEIPPHMIVSQYIFTFSASWC